MDTSYYNRFGAEELHAPLVERDLVGAGPHGQCSLRKYDAADIPPAFWNLAEPQTVSRIHRLYVAAGAQVLITNTFQASSSPQARPDCAVRGGGQSRGRRRCPPGAPSAAAGLDGSDRY